MRGYPALSEPHWQLLPQLQFSHVQFGLSHFADAAVSLLVMHMRLIPTGTVRVANTPRDPSPVPQSSPGSPNMFAWTVP